MKHLNERTEAIISTTNVRVDYKNDVKEGDIVPHKELVQNVKIYTPIYDQNGYTVSHQLIAISKDDILDIAKQIQEIESKRFDSPYDSYQINELGERPLEIFGIEKLYDELFIKSNN